MTKRSVRTEKRSSTYRLALAAAWMSVAVTHAHAQAPVADLADLAAGLAAIALQPEAQPQAAPPPGQPAILTCSSKAGERQHCRANTSAGVALRRSTGEADCLLGKTWGYDDAGVWV